MKAFLYGAKKYNYAKKEDLIREINVAENVSVITDETYRYVFYKNWRFPEQAKKISVSNLEFYINPIKVNRGVVVLVQVPYLICFSDKRVFVKQENLDEKGEIKNIEILSSLDTIINDAVKILNN